jgi:ketosteroid isomerase-like protein
MTPASADRLERLEHRVAVLEAREAIRRRLDAYAEAIDVRDRAALEDLVTQDVCFVVTAEGTERRGRTELCDYLADLLAPMGPTVHYAVGAVDIAVDGATAVSSHKGVAQHTRHGQFEVAVLTYEHEWRREPDGVWRISRRAVVPWYFRPLAEILAHGWDPSALEAPTGPPRRLPWSSSTWPQRFDRSDSDS